MDVTRIVALSISVTLASAGSSSAAPLAPQESCEPSWLPTFGNSHGISTGISAFAVLDDGVGPPQLFAGGGYPTGQVARWDGARWDDLGTTTHSVWSTIYTLVVFDDGDGPAVYAGGPFTTAGGVAANNIARWDGAAWSPLGSGMNGAVEALCVHDDGTGPALYAGGSFNTAGGVTVNRVARWDGASWSPLDSGMNGKVRSLAVLDDGSGPALYAGGEFTLAGTASANRIARWNGTKWTAVGSGMLNGSVQALAMFDDGSGPALYAAGAFTGAGGTPARHIARWDGSAWSPVGNWTSGGSSVWSLGVFDDGGGPALYAGGNFDVAGGVPASNLARWDGVSWSTVAGGTSHSVSALLPYDDGDGAVLLAGGSFLRAGGVPARRIAAWNGTSWSAVGDALDASVRALAEFDDGGGAALHAGGQFTAAGGVVLNHVARWNGDGWSPLGGGANGDVQALAVFDDGGGPALFAGGKFTNASGAAANLVARWDGASWTPLAGGLVGGQGEVRALAVFDDGSGPALYAGGRFVSAGGVTAHHIARWDGSAWSALGSGTELPSTGWTAVSALAVFDDGSGPALYVGGFFTMAGIGEAHLARWDGASWSGLGAGFDEDLEEVSALAVFDAGGAPALHVGGSFASAGGVVANGIARFDGSSWAPLGAGTNGAVFALAALGSGARLYAGGTFTTAGGGAASRIASWDGTSWAPLGAGRDDTVEALAILDDGDGTAALVAGGEFDEPVDSGDTQVALWDVGPDETPPILTCPVSVIVHVPPNGPAGKVVHFSVVAVDGCDPSPSVVCNPPSGSFFPRGTTIVTCTASDAGGNESVCEFPVTVQPGVHRKL